MSQLEFRLELPKKAGEYVLFSLPQTNQYQKITSLEIEPRKYKRFKENKWGNDIVSFTLNDVKHYACINFNHKAISINQTIDSTFKINEYSRITNPDRFINGKDVQIQRLAKKIVGEEKSLAKTIKNIYRFVLTYLTYGKPNKALYTYKQALRERTTDCGGFSTLLLSLLQSVNIPSRLVVGYLLRPSLSKLFLTKLRIDSLTFRSLSMHVWVEILLPDDSWFPLDPSIEWQRVNNFTSSQGDFGIIPDDRLVLSYGEDFDLNIGTKNYKIDLFQSPVYI